MVILIVPIYTSEVNENKDIITVPENNKSAKLFSFDSSQTQGLFWDGFFSRLPNHSHNKQKPLKYLKETYAILS